MAHTTEDELQMALPPAMLEEALKGYQALWAVGWRYPVPALGHEADPWMGLSKFYGRDGIKKRAAGRSAWD